MLLDKICELNDIKTIEKNQYSALAQEIRDFLIEHVSETGGHLASNLGTVELTMALHIALDLPEDKIVWDVGHQSYTHKLLTGRRQEFDTLRSYGGMSGFPKKREHPCDVFDTGHSSTSISAALGIVQANEISGKNGTAVAVIGDGALTGGMAFEALNNAASLKRNMLIILNDNKMSISENVGGMSKYLSNLRTATSYNNLKDGVVETLNSIPVVGDKLVRQIRRTKSGIKQLVIPGMLFENMGIIYLGPVDGHNVEKLVKLIQEARRVEHPVLIHVITKKGKGYPYAEKYPEAFHATPPFHIDTGKPVRKKTKSTYTDVFAKTMVQLAEKYPQMVAVTAAMPEGTGLKKFQKEYPERFFDVGIAEEHAVTFAAGMAAVGLRPVVAIYSSFLQRAYDQILHDVCIQDLPVIFAIDRAGIVGEDGETHQGIFDLSYLSHIPNMNIFAPKNRYELVDAMKFAMEFQGPIAIRYPRGEACTELSEYRTPIMLGKSEVLQWGKEIALFCVGSMVQTGRKVRELLVQQGYCPTFVNARFVKPLDEQLIDKVQETHQYLITLEENIANGGYGEHVLRYASCRNYALKVLPFAIPNQFITHGEASVVKKSIGLDAETIAEQILKYIKGENALRRII